MEALLTLLREYGSWVYLLLFGYCALKSGWLPLFAGYAAHTGALEVFVVAISSFAGGYLGDELRFAVARRYGVRWLSGRGRLQRLFEQAVSRIPRGIPINSILLPMEGDPMAAWAYWNLALYTQGAFLTPARDWP